jgi:hypothetical protein
LAKRANFGPSATTHRGAVLCSRVRCTLMGGFPNWSGISNEFCRGMRISVQPFNGMSDMVFLSLWCCVGGAAPARLMKDR